MTNWTKWDDPTSDPLGDILREKNRTMNSKVTPFMAKTEHIESMIQLCKDYAPHNLAGWEALLEAHHNPTGSREVFGFGVP